MKKILLSLFAITTALASSAQCQADAHNWGGATYGVSPNPQVGENFNDAVLGLPYTQVIYVKAPTNAGDINPLFNGIPIDSLRLEDVVLTVNGADVSLSSLGLNITCNNNGDSPDPCMFLGGGAYCGDVSGTPNQAGSFPAKINVTVFGVVFGSPQSFPYQFTNFTLNVIDPNLVKEEPALTLNISPNVPNPVSNYTDFNFELNRSGEVKVAVYNLVGEKIYEKNVMGRRGANSFRFDADQVPNGVYLYSIEAGGKKLTRRMVVQH